jgi:hypothetical protein
MFNSRSPQDDNAINRVLRTRGLPTLDKPGAVAHLAGMVEDHQHFTELLRACEPALRREMYEAMRPHLRFAALPLDDYIIRAKEQAEAGELLVMDTQGNLKAYSMPQVFLQQMAAFELYVACSRCATLAIFLGRNQADAIANGRNAGWAWDESIERRHLCTKCLEEIPNAMDTETGN